VNSVIKLLLYLIQIKRKYEEIIR